MRYFVTLTAIENTTPASGNDTKAAIQMIERSVTPTLETLGKWEREKRVFGGCISGAREIAFVIEANSNEEVGELIHQLPIWSLVTTTIRPLESFEFRLNQDRKFLNEMKKHY